MGTAAGVAVARGVVEAGHRSRIPGVHVYLGGFDIIPKKKDIRPDTASARPDREGRSRRRKEVPVVLLMYYILYIIYYLLYYYMLYRGHIYPQPATRTTEGREALLAFGGCSGCSAPFFSVKNLPAQRA
jgi:hypothetical protein